MGIRLATFEDIEGMAMVAVRGWQWAYKGVISQEELDRLDIGARVMRMQTRWRPERYCLVATDEHDSVIGFAVEQLPPSLAAFDCEIGGLYVDPDHARAGHGRTLVEAMIREFTSRKCRSMCIHTLRENRIGRNFYEKIGGTLVAEDEWNEYPAVW